MRQADSTIKGYLYQFNKSLYEILSAEENTSIVLEGVIEDIDIHSTSGITTIQCKYHEDSKYQISSVAAPILEMLCHYCESVYLGKAVSYILYAYYSENVDYVDMNAFSEYLQSTKDKDILCKYFHRIYNIPDTKILTIANKQKKSKNEKEELIGYYKTNRASLTLKVNLSEFWQVFTYVKAKQFNVLKKEVVQQLSLITEETTAASLYYPNAFSLVALLSTKTSESERTITKGKLFSFLSEQKTLLLNRWTLEALGREQVLKTKKGHLSSMFSSNADVRAFVFTDSFLDKNEDEIVSFIHSYLDKYYKKPRLQKPPIFVFGDAYSTLMQTSLMELYKYQRPVNTGLLGNVFVPDSFINNTNCSSDIVCKMALLQNVSVPLLERCHVNQVYVIGTNNTQLKSVNFVTEELDIPDINTLKYLINLTKILEV